MLTVQSLVFLLLLLLKRERNFLPPDNSPPPSLFSLLNSEYSPHVFYLKIPVAHFFVHKSMKYNYVIFNKQKTMGTQHTMGFVVHHIIYSLVWVLPDGQIQCTQIWVLCGKTWPMDYPYWTLPLLQGWHFNTSGLWLTKWKFGTLKCILIEFSDELVAGSHRSQNCMF